MTPQYYIPTIEEFYVGFEYEVNGKEINLLLTDSLNPYKIEEDCWVKRKLEFIHEYSSDNIVATLLDRNDIVKLIRVKVLDREDIESLGGEYINTIGSTVNYCIKKSTGVPLRITTIGDRLIIYNHLADDHRLFDGKVKNKSELKKLLQMLGINGYGSYRWRRH
ncbi:hypothetical protein MEN24_17850 [Dolichospermum sp. ST_sed10]|nr:hypothetical protein [Dolichospermum sp. ST_sed10]